MQVMRKILWDKRYSGFVWHLRIRKLNTVPVTPAHGIQM